MPTGFDYAEDICDGNVLPEYFSLLLKFKTSRSPGSVTLLNITKDDDVQLAVILDKCAGQQMVHIYFPTQCHDRQLMFPIEAPPAGHDDWQRMSLEFTPDGVLFYDNCLNISYIPVNNRDCKIHCQTVALAQPFVPTVDFGQGRISRQCQPFSNVSHLMHIIIILLCGTFRFICVALSADIFVANPHDA